MARIVSPPFEIRQGVRQGGILSTLHYKLYNNDLLHLLEFLRAGMSIGHIDCSCPTCSDDVALLAKFFLCLQLLLVLVTFFICREHYFINAQKSAEVDLNENAKKTSVNRSKLSEVRGLRRVTLRCTLV